jgi:phenylacetate-CoA ligase
MRFNEIIRNRAYCFLSYLRSDKTNAYSKELALFREAGRPIARVEEKLRTFLHAAQRNTSKYRTYSGNFNLDSYPVITKKQIKADADAYLTKMFPTEQLLKVHTSGSYGTPIDFYFTKDKKMRQRAEVIYYSSFSGYNVGVKHALFMSNPRKSRFKYWLQNETLVASKNLDEVFLTYGRTLLRNKKIRILIGFPSAIAFLAQYCIDLGDNPADFGVEGVITCSENLTDHKRRAIADAFGCSVHNRYSTEELGVLAYEFDALSGFEVNTFNYIVEILEMDSDTTVLPGQIGRVVVTDLHSDAMPLIRYETGDLAVMKEAYEGTGWVKSFSKFSGRGVQILTDTQGNKLYPLYLDSIMENYDQFNQYQFIQETAKEYTLQLVLNLPAIPDSMNERLTADFKKWLGIDAMISIRKVNDIIALPSGKRPYVINRYAE